MTSSRPYFIRAIYDWLVDNRLTPYLMVDAEFAGVQAPEQFVEDGKIVLNIAPQAIGNLKMTNQEVEFDASFSGVITHIYAPIRSVEAIYAFENGRGMVFEEDEDQDDDGGDPPPSDDKPPALRVVK